MLKYFNNPVKIPSRTLQSKLGTCWCCCCYLLDVVVVTYLMLLLLQLATIVLVGINDVGGVIVGGCLGHFICTGGAGIVGCCLEHFIWLNWRRRYCWRLFRTLYLNWRRRYCWRLFITLLLESVYNILSALEGQVLLEAVKDTFSALEGQVVLEAVKDICSALEGQVQILIFLKGFSTCHKLWFSNPHIFANQCQRPEVFQRSNNLSLKYHRFEPSGYTNIGILVIPLLSMNEAWTDGCAARLQPLVDQ